MEKYYTSEKHTQILIALMKFHGIKKIVASPGATNVCLVGSLQQDPYFEIYSSVDERSAAFIACGLAAESGEPVALTCTGSTASRNYVPGLTEAFYRKLPVLAITTTQHLGRVGNGYGQVIDRSQQMKDLVKESVLVDCVYTPEDEWACGVSINKALIALRKNGGGPVHINLVTTYSKDFSTRMLPKVKGIRYTENLKDMPKLEKGKKIAILVGVHRKWSSELTQAVEDFCKAYNAVVLMNHACNYKGDFGVNHAIMVYMQQYISPNLNADIVIYIGSIARYASGIINPNCVMWRVSPDGEIWDSERKLTHVFNMEETDFFRYYADLQRDEMDNIQENTFAKTMQEEYESIIAQTPELPFSNVFIAQNTIEKLPDNCVFHVAGSNTARAWNFFKLPKSVECYSNDGTMGIDGQVSALIGESLASPERLHFGVVGDLTFFYDMNSIGNRHVLNNLRLLVVNNGKGAEFKIYTHPASEWGSETEKFMAAAGHYGNKSTELIKHYAQDLGYEYLSANNKEEYLKNVNRFLTPEITEHSIIFEVFTDSTDESRAIYEMNHIVSSVEGKAVYFAKDMIKSLAGEKGVEKVKAFLKH